ncbi:probable WRKY transcription factor 32 isoform X2 [Hibiscus syriacus]|uniref:probable WRKY transcription factor 32 isoform X2 n=1 Tax=Hibiscus syriacus TaxID=106335 RepID=UPI00192289DC|nr:probable WRKY transcription factor 32 isoform X2 [Hibiscus syriacus]
MAETESEAQPMERHEEKKNDDSIGEADELDAEEGEDKEGVSRVDESDKEGAAPSSDAELKDSRLEYLTNDDRREGLQENSTSESKEVAESKDQVKIAHQEMPNLAFQDTESPKQNLVHKSVLPEPSPSFLKQNPVHESVLPEPSPSSLKQNLIQLSVMPEPSPTSPKQSHSDQKVNISSLAEANQQSPSNLKVVPFVPNVKTPVSDGYNWRKYGQKQVKSPKGSRSYYKCTFSNCQVKKIECSDHTGYVIEIVNKGIHSHEPPRKINFTRESKVLSSVVPVSMNLVTEQSVRVPNDSDPSTSSKESLPETTVNPERKQQCSSGSDGNGNSQMKEELLSEAEPNKRRKKGDAVCSGSAVKTGKKPKFVVHAAGDVGISGDGYRWRKYGQKMVKGNSNPRNYYRCTSAGCPVRKHIETAVDNTNAIVITYKGIHDHDMPVPKKRHGPSSAPLVAAAAPASMNSLQLTVADEVQKQITSTKWSVGRGGELTGEAVELGGEKAMESARTLLSIGFEIKPC